MENKPSVSPHTSILNIKMELLLHAHGGEGTVDDELVGMVEVHAESLRRVVIVARRRVDQALVAL